MPHPSFGAQKTFVILKKSKGGQKKSRSWLGELVCFNVGICSSYGGLRVGMAGVSTNKSASVFGFWTELKFEVICEIMNLQP